MLRRDAREDWRAIRTLSALKRPQKLPDRGGALLSGLSDVELAFAAQNPAYPETTRESARLALSGRVGAPKALAAIDAFIDALPPKSWLKADDVAADDRVFFGVGRWLRMSLGVLAFLSIFPWLILGAQLTDARDAGLARAVAAAVVTQAEVDAAREEPPSGARGADGQLLPNADQKLRALADRPAVSPYMAEWRRIDYWFGHSIWLTLVAAPGWTLAVGLRRKPARVLLLRRFNNRTVDRSLSALAQKELRPYGHVFTLADKFFRRSRLAMLVSWFSFNPFVLAWRLVNIPIGFVRRLFDRSRAGPIMIWNARDYRNFVRRLSDRWGLNLEVLRARRNAVMVRTSDDWWQHVIVLLMHAADAIVIDVTEVAGGTKWELHNILSERVRHKIVFVACDTHAESARAALTEHGFADMADGLILYRKGGKPHDRASLRAAMLGAIRRRLAGD